MINGMIPSSDGPEKVQLRPLYVIYNEKRPGIYTSYEQIVILKNEIERKKGSPSFAEYMDIDKALAKTRIAIWPNYYIEPSVSEYIQSYRLIQNNNKTSEEPKIKKSIGIKIREEVSTSMKPAYKECLKKEVDPLDGEYIDWKIEEKF